MTFKCQSLEQKSKDKEKGEEEESCGVGKRVNKDVKMTQ